MIELTPLWQFQQKLNIIDKIKVDFMAEPLNWIALYFTGVPNKVAAGWYDLKLDQIWQVFVLSRNFLSTLSKVKNDLFMSMN